jgi:hypothetical protein
MVVAPPPRTAEQDVMSKITVDVLTGGFAISRLDPGSAIPPWAPGSFVSITFTHDEISLVCPEENVLDGVETERGWRGLAVAGRLDFSLVGILSSLLGPLAQAGIPVFVTSTFNTDYLFVKQGRLEQALEVLRKAGHEISSEVV